MSQSLRNMGDRANPILQSMRLASVLWLEDPPGSGQLAHHLES
eukprot:CAMPEP_0172758088 /NCGR_PEP_ID=MMETSP1074-20121228/165089_1 /TAXON_ID=2916 /ORGANISM="Ceratium fusus, Strain PA161109" /LENGTH=42 /DNA_ID= /DNA_START= /DNA_END= /DNA_ORIENTATION=